jgi:formate-dependent nitrite reductase membrane component NrfD
LGSGLYLNRLLFGIDVGRILGLPLADVLGIILVSIGGVILIADLGKPLRFLRALRNVRSSWISPGAIADFVFLLLGGLLILPYLTIGGHQPLAALPWAPGTGLEQVLTWITAVAALLIIVYPGLVLSSPCAIPFWHTTLIPWQYLSSALASAAGIAYLVGSPASSRITAVVALISVLATLAFSLAHIQKARSRRGAARMSADKVIRGPLAPHFLWGNLVLGLMMPGLILALSLTGELAGGVLALAAVLLLAGNFLSKYAVIKAGYYASLS